MSDGPVNEQARRASRILVVDDEPANVLLLQRMLEDDGYQAITTTTDSRRVLDLYRALRPDLIVLDLMMPHLDGIAVLEQLDGEIPADTYVPVLVLTADATLEARRRALAAGAHDFLTKPFERFEALLRIKNLLHTRRLYVALEEHNRALEDTVRQRTERLMQSEKVAAMGSLLAGVAHELNNPLTVLSGQAQLIGQGDPVLGRRAVTIQRAADRCVRIVRNFLALARQQPPERSEVVLKQVVDGALELVAYELRTEGVELTVDVPEGLPRLWADAHQLHQVLVNMLVNAQHAMRRQTQPRRLAVRVRPGVGRVRVEIADTGRGIAPEVLARIFEPFFTTKPSGEGTGLGLSLCRSIVEDHGGTITVESLPGRGTTFGIELPVTPRPGTAARSAAAAATPPAPPSRVLVVDDEAGVAEVVAEAIARDGHRGDIASHGAMALEMLERDAYDAVVSDTKMPVMDGEGFYGELTQRFPALRRRFVFLTGDVLSREKRTFLEGTGAPVLSKPCDLDEVRRVLNGVLTQPR